MRAIGWILRALLALNFALFLLTFVPAFSGIGPEAGLADRLWGNYRFGGWRADVVWMCGSTMFLLAAGLVWISRNRSAKITIIAYSLWMACFLFYLGYVFLHMFG
jgi:hypothetical protein